MSLDRKLFGASSIGSPLLSTLAAVMPLVVLLGLPAFAGWPAHRVAVAGGYFGLFPIGWIIIGAMFLFRLSVEAGALEVMKQSVTSLSAGIGSRLCSSPARSGPS